MPTVEKLRERIIEKLKELFQLDQPDLDFGFYRIMHAKVGQVTKFLEDDLFKIIKGAFGQIDGQKRAELQKAYEDAIQQAKDFGAPVPENTPAVQKAKAALDALNDNANAEGEIYDHLYRFFERYYDGGDFISLRYYARETSGKAAPYAIPYSGEEVKLHWANADQYYIKTAEYFSHFTFDLRQAEEVKKSRGELFKSQHEEEKPLRVHFKIVEASEGEHGNVKASDQTKRFFIVYKDDPVAFDEQGELICHFEYRPDQEKGSAQEGNWREHRNNEAVNVILSALKELENVNEYLELLKIPAPTDKQKDRPLLAKYINQYTARNTWDYFIHKDLGAFLNRELDFYIKNEVMRLDDIENAEAPAVEAYLSKIKVLRQIAHKIIDFLAQLEDFQKKLWLKKKFVVESNYCLTLDRVPEQLYPQIAQNKAQGQEWIKLFCIDEIEKDLHNPGYSDPLSVEFLKANPHLVLDTSFFTDNFKTQLIAVIDDFDEQCDGLLIHSENFQALNLLQKRYKEQVKCIYIDPPYNTDASPILYKNGYKHSSWISLLVDRLKAAIAIRQHGSILCVAIDDYEYPNLFNALQSSLIDTHLATVAVRSKPQGRPTSAGFSANHEYAVFWSNDEHATIGRLPRKGSKAERYPLRDEKGIFAWANFRKSGSDSNRTDRKKSFYPLFISSSKIRLPHMEWNKSLERWKILEEPGEGEKEIWPIDGEGNEKVWTCSAERAYREISDLKIINKSDGGIEIHKKYRPNQTGALPGTWWEKSEYSASESGTKVLKNLFGGKDFDFPKSINLVVDNLRVSNLNYDQFVFDFFAGSGTTGHAVINLNREDEGSRKYILVEMGDYFDTVLKPRIQKVVYSKEWKNGKPTARDTGISHCFKYLRLESYEDTLNNLLFEENPARDRLLANNASLREDYTLRYMLEVESRGSHSLLNIDAFADPTAYQLKVKKPGSDEYVMRNVDLLETFNYLIGLRVTHIAAPQSFSAEFKREPDPELPEDQNTRLIVDGKIRQDEDGPWLFRKVEGWLPADSNNPNNGQKEKVLIVWRKLTGDLEKDNLMLDEFFTKNRISTRDFEFDTIYTNGSNNLPNLKLEGDNWKVRLIEEDFMRLMWEAGE